MTSSRLRDDASTYRKILRQSVDPLSYVLDPSKYVHTQTCRPVFGILGGNNVSTVPNMVDAESTLWNINRPARYDAAAQDDRALGAAVHHLGSCQFQTFKTVPGAVWTPPAETPSQWRSHMDAGIPYGTVSTHTSAPP